MNVTIFHTPRNSNVGTVLDQNEDNILTCIFNLLNPTGYVMHQQFNIQQLYVLPTLYLCVLYLSENKQRLVPLTA
jgi:hypothetical protein